jgi:hypothetical protein
MVAIDARSGTTVWATAPGIFTGWPDLCVDDPTMVCAAGNLDASNSSQVLRYAAATGAPEAPITIGNAGGGRDLGPDLFDPGERSPEMLVATAGGTVTWQEPLANVFTETGASTDNGWNFDRIPSDGLFVGAVQGPPLSSSNTQEVIDLSRTMTAGFRMTNGAAVWRDPGSFYMCSILPCPGGNQTSSGTTAYQPPTLGLRLRETGTVSAAQGSPAKVSPGATVTVEGFDLATGRTVWSFNAGGDLSLIQQSPPPQVGAETVILPGAGGALEALDLATGARQPVSAGSLAWCQAETTYTANTSNQAANGSSTSSYQGNYAVFPCDRAGHPVPAPAAVPAYAGPSIGGTTAWSEANEVAAAPTA